MFYKAILLTAFVVSIQVFFSCAGQPRRLREYEYNCTAEGQFCLDCNKVVYCEMLPNGTVEAFEGDNCTLPQTCLEEAGGDAVCSSKDNDGCHPSVALYDFKCQQTGIFPHPFDCKKFYMCREESDTTPIEGTCPEDYGFDPQTMLCSNKLNKDKCEVLVKPCATTGSGPIRGNLRYYYSCRRPTPTDYYVPYMLHCLNNTIFIDGRCIEPSQSSPVILNGVCQAAGFYYFSNCRQYHECAVGKVPITRSCSSGYNFNPQTHKCEPCTCSWAK